MQDGSDSNNNVQQQDSHQHNNLLLSSPTIKHQRQQTRVILWAIPRSISTAFFRAIMEGVRIKVLLEPFSNAYYFGEERISKRYANKMPTLGCRFRDIVRIYEQPYKSYRSVFVKDMAYYLHKEQNLSKLLPNGYTHTFLIRHPAQSVASLYRLSIDKERTGWDWFNPAEAGFKELYELFHYVTNHLGQRAIVVDADDLIKNPRKTLIRYCSLTGLEFSEKMLSWKSISYDGDMPSLVDNSSSSIKMTGIVAGDLHHHHNLNHHHVDLINSCASAASLPALHEHEEDDDDCDNNNNNDNNDDELMLMTTTNVSSSSPLPSPSIPPEIFRGWQPWFEGVLSSTSFCEFNNLQQPSSFVPPILLASSKHHENKRKKQMNNDSSIAADSSSNSSSLPEKVIDCINECIPYYEALKKFKI